ncbi:MAG: cytochrome b/b6 domain-containing protein [Rhodovarius sp.]|nr:cytochrome b/b6 domain-containing protein [Rhodovarius sp.]
MAYHYVKVWDVFVRLHHWLILALMAVSYATARAHRMDWHMLSGYAILTLVIFRILWGFFGSESARFARFLRSPAAAWRQLRGLTKAEPDREPTHNAAGGWMVLLLLCMLLLQAGSGLFSYDQIFTYGPLAKRVPEPVMEAASALHVRLFYWLLGAVAVHVTAVALYRVLKGHDLLQPMITGVKKLPADVPAPKLASPALGLLLLGLSAGFVWWITTLRIGL